MAKLEKVLVAYDGSPQSDEALQWSIYFGRRTGASIYAVKVFEPILREARWQEVGSIPTEMFEKFAAAQKEDLQLMERVREKGRGQEVDITTAPLTGRVSQALLNYAKKQGISMIVTGTRGQGAVKQLLFGSVTHGLVSAADIPVLVVKHYPTSEAAEKSAEVGAARKILVAFDGYPQSQAALDWAIEIAKHIAAQVMTVTVVEPFQVGMAYAMAEGGSPARTAEMLKEMETLNLKIMRDAQEIGRARGVTVETKLLHGNVLERLLEFCRQNAVDIIAVGAQGHGLLDAMPLGSVSNGLVGLSPVPVLVVKK